MKLVKYSVHSIIAFQIDRIYSIEKTYKSNNTGIEVRFGIKANE